MLGGWCGWMASPMDDLGSDSFVVLLNEGAKGPGPKAEALEAISLRPIWLATWEPRAEGFRTLINAAGEEALAVFSSEKQLKEAARREQREREALDQRFQSLVAKGGAKVKPGGETVAGPPPPSPDAI